MAFDGQPVPSTEYQIPVAKISDGKSVVVTATGDVVQGNFYEIEGFFGAAMTNGKAGDKVVLNIEQAEYSTVQVVDGATFSVGSLVYWDGTAFTNDVGTSNRLVGRCTSYDSVNKVLTFILGPIDTELAARIKNGGGVPSIQAGLDAEKPAPGTAGGLYIATDTQIIYRDTGSAWQKIGVVNWNDISGKPTSFTPNAHKDTHAIGGTDVLTPQDIGAAQTEQG